jgi:hypothetical protein
MFCLRGDATRDKPMGNTCNIILDYKQGSRFVGRAE